MHDDPNHEIDVRQAAIAERLEVKPDPETPGVRHVELEGQRVGKVVYLGGEEWLVFYRSGYDYRDGLNALMAPLEAVEEADRHGVGWVADAIARGEIRLDGEAL